MTTNIYNMLADLSRGALADLLRLPETEEHGHFALLTLARAHYKNGTLSGARIVAAWESECDDHEPIERDGNSAPFSLEPPEEPS